MFNLEIGSVCCSITEFNSHGLLKCCNWFINHFVADGQNTCLICLKNINLVGRLDLQEQSAGYKQAQ